VSESDDSFLSIEALAGLGLHRQPFGPQPPDAFLFSDPVLDMPMNVALQHLRSDPAPVLLRGERGIGKTTLLRRLRAAAGEDLHFCTIEGTSDLSMAAVDYCVRLQWQPRPSHGNPRQLGIDAYLAALVRDGLRPVLLIDDAHRLEADLLGKLLALHAQLLAANTPVGLVLAAEPRIETGLASCGPDALTPLVTLALRPFGREQLGAYLDHRMRLAGARRGSGFDADTLTRLLRESGGLPERANQLANEALEQRHSGAPTQRPWQAATATRFVVPGVLVLVAAGLGILLLGVLGGQPSQPTEPSVAVVTGTDPPAEGGAGSGGPVAEPSPEDPATPAVGPNDAALPRETSPGQGPEPLSTESPTQSPAAEPSTRADAEPEALPEPAEATREAEPQAAAAPDGDSPAGAGASPPQASTPPEPTGAGEPGPVVASPATQAADAQTSDVAVEPGSAPVRDAAWLRTQPADAYTIQLLAVGSEESVRAFAERHSLPAPAIVLRAEREGRPWWILCAGVYQNAATARAAIRDLSGTLRANQPWVRRVGDLLQSAGTPSL
jgi:DamX protein